MSSSPSSSAFQTCSRGVSILISNLSLPYRKLSLPAEAECQRTLQNQTLYWYETVVDTPHPPRPLFPPHQNHRCVGGISVSCLRHSLVKPLCTTGRASDCGHCIFEGGFHSPHEHPPLSLLCPAWSLGGKLDRMAPVLDL